MDPRPVYSLCGWPKFHIFSIALSESSQPYSRPPGHHAGTSLSGGYCFINNVAVAARFLQGFNQRPTEKVTIAILDVDYHHGNGSERIALSRALSCRTDF